LMLPRGLKNNCSKLQIPPFSYDKNEQDGMLFRFFSMRLHPSLDSSCYHSPAQIRPVTIL
jgi:hypothetical protein